MNGIQTSIIALLATGIPTKAALVEGSNVTIPAPQAFHTLEFTEIPRDQDEPATAGMAGDKGIASADHRASFAKIGTNVGGVIGRLGIEG